MNARVWSLEWRLALRRPRLLLWNLGIPVALLAPVALSPAAAPHRAAVFAVLFVLFGTFGACIPLVRDAASGWTTRLLLTGYGERRWLLERLAASTGLDVVQLLPATVLLAAAGASPGELVALLPALVLALAAANLLGCLAAAAVRSLAEAALACAALSLGALHLAGVFRTPTEGTWASAAARWNPFRPLHERLLEAASDTLPAAGSAAGLEPAMAPWLAALALLAAVAAAAPALARRLGSEVGS